MIEIFAVAPQAGAMIHLHSPGYQPGAKRRSIGDHASLCGVLAVTRTAQTAPLAEALSWPDTHKDCGCPRSGWRWCKPCLGHAATLAGVVDQLLAALVDAITPCSCGGRRWVEDENWSPEYPEEWKGERSQGNGLIPCGSCNHGGWDVDEYEVDAP